jgi:hypothetical protein
MDYQDKDNTLCRWKCSFWSRLFPSYLHTLQGSLCVSTDAYVQGQNKPNKMPRDHVFLTTPNAGLLLRIWTTNPNDLLRVILLLAWSKQAIRIWLVHTRYLCGLWIGKMSTTKKNRRPFFQRREKREREVKRLRQLISEKKTTITTVRRIPSCAN